jgi:hypothetical protein
MFGQRRRVILIAIGLAILLTPALMHAAAVPGLSVARPSPSAVEVAIATSLLHHSVSGAAVRQFSTFGLHPDPADNSNVGSHTFHFVTPVDTDLLKIPNAGNTWHMFKTGAWAEAALKTGSDGTPWRMFQ